MRESFSNKILGKLGFNVLKSGKEIELVGLKKIETLRLVFSYFSFLLLGWGLYRLLFRLPESIEETILKPIFWLGSLFWVIKYRDKKPFSSLGISTKGLFRSLYLGLGLGFLFAFEGVAVNWVKYGGLSFSPLDYSLKNLLGLFLISVITAISEELVFRGFIFNRLLEVWKKEWFTNLVVSFLFALVHLPVTIFVLRYDFGQVLTYAFIVFVYSLGSGFVFARTKTITASVLLHVFWSWPLILFR